MWRSEEDVIKDLASLNDFGVPGDKEPYQVLYSIGRGSRIQKKSEKTFIDPRTGEAIDISDSPLDLNNSPKQGKGRGSAIGSLSKTQFQLMKQLRLARPLGSGDEAIESFCRRNRPVEKSSISKPNTSSVKITSETKAGLSNYSEKNKIKIKATRHSNLKSNALIEGLLSKAQKITKLSIKEQGGSTNSISDDNIKKKNRQKEISSENDSLTKESSNYDSDNFSDDDNVEDNSNNNGNNLCQSKNRFDDFPNSSTTSCGSFEKSQDCNEKYKRLGERLKTSGISQQPVGEGIYDFDHTRKFISSIKPYPNVPETIFTEPEVKHMFVLDEEEFPPLCKK